MEFVRGEPYHLRLHPSSVSAIIAERDWPRGRYPISGSTDSHYIREAIGGSVTFVSIGTDFEAQPAHLAKFTWDSSSEDKLPIDEAGYFRVAIRNPYRQERPCGGCGTGLRLTNGRTYVEGGGLSSATFAGPANLAPAVEGLFYVLAFARHARVYLQTF